MMQNTINAVTMDETSKGKVLAASMSAYFKSVYLVLVEWFDSPTPRGVDFSEWRREQYDRLERREIGNLPLKTWWPKYTDEDFRLEICVGALLVQQVSWISVKRCIKDISGFLEERGEAFDTTGLLRIGFEKLQELIRPSRFAQKKAERIIQLCRLVEGRFGSLEAMFSNRTDGTLGEILKDTNAGFGPETRDCVLLYAANRPVFIADSYARILLSLLGMEGSGKYGICQEVYEAGIREAFSPKDLNAIADDYTPDERQYALCNAPDSPDHGLVLLYQQFHAGIDELGISKQWKPFIEDVRSRTSDA